MRGLWHLRVTSQPLPSGRREATLWPMNILFEALAWSVRGMIFALGLRAAWSDVNFLWRQPGLLVRSLLAMYVIIPVFAVMMTASSPSIIRKLP